MQEAKNLTFDDALSRLESLLDTIEEGAKDGKISEAEIDSKIEEAEKLRDYCKDLLRKEKEDIIRVAKENNIPLEEIGISEDDDDDDDDDDDKTKF
ncbi:MAG: hypothetical protein LBS34_03465 [Rickettsiales bacterium]|jgi:hypothetical protein|nr:hypothetical protein [Rickettsiales bacterium]